MDLKESLNLPDPNFTIPMKADLAVREPEQQVVWDEMDIYGQIQKVRQSDPAYVLHDGPPYTNNPIHIGTAFNKILKDFVLKSRLVMGYRVPYVPGYDNHGLPIEQAVMKRFQEKKEAPSKIELRRACREHAEKYINLQTSQFKRLGIFGLWERPYTTMEYRFEAEIVRVFKRLVELGYVYRGQRPTLWSPTAQTALADTEIVYKEVTSKSIFVRFPLESWPFEGLPNTYALIWTTTPWTIPANLALAFHPKHTYDVLRVGEDHYIVVHELVEQVASKVDWGSWEVVKSFIGSEIEGSQFKHPVFDRLSLAVLAEYVTTEDGTGVVHTAPGHGRDDFFTGQKYGLPVLCPVDGRGVLTEEAGEFAGTHYKKCDTVVVDRIRELGHLLAVDDYKHSYPHAERDDQPVIFRATKQWFVSIDHEGLRAKMVDAINHKVEWTPRSGHTRMLAMMSQRPDWCISRQRPWGVGIPIFYGKESGEPVLDSDAIESVAKLVEDHGSDAWYERDPQDILPPGFKHPVTGETEFIKETDVFDVWFDSGSTCHTVIGGLVDPRWKENLPVDVYFEGSDQHRGWFNLSMILSMATLGTHPYKRVATHGFVNDETGQKMSKRTGNVIDPVLVCDQHGADVLRYWASSVNFEDDVPISDNLLKVAGEGYRRIRNTLRFLLGNLYDYDPDADFELLELDRWIIERTDGLVRDCLDDFDRYRFNNALARIHNFCVHELSAFYADAIKDRVYCDGAGWPSRRSAQAACLSVLRKLTLLVAPIVPHTAEEVYTRIPGAKHASVFLDRLERGEDKFDKSLHMRFDKLLDVRAWVFAEFETWKVGSETRDSQDVSLGLVVSPDDAACLETFGDELSVYFKMADVTVTKGEPSASFSASHWPKCERSRLRRSDVSQVQVNGTAYWLTSRDRRVLGV